ncbi:Hpt domain-containing protein [Puteibacter caeruleilacunae]|nr:Hpt domain-containing protein [Puteibacter caeruleilacunae]
MSTQRITDLSYLREVAGDESLVIKEMLELFIAQVPEFTTNLRRHLANEEYIALGKEAHKAKSSVLVVGMEDMGKKLKRLQLMTEQGDNINDYPAYVDDFINSCNQAVEELEEELSHL